MKVYEIQFRERFHETWRSLGLFFSTREKAENAVESEKLEDEVTGNDGRWEYSILERKVIE